MSFKLKIIAPEKVVFAGDVESLIAPGKEGELTILGHHAPLITSLKTGHLIVNKVGGITEQVPVTKGVLEVSHNQATVLL